jgi:hypothetical protein
MYSQRHTFSQEDVSNIETSQRLINNAAKTDNENATQASYRVSNQTVLAREAQ